MVAMMLASVPTADSEGSLSDGGLANGTCSAITGASMKAAIKKPVKKRFIADPLRLVRSTKANSENGRTLGYDK
jgi:hypothetical protein